ncbi:cupin domain-containing protein [Stackebrandtia albiflava]|uniref:cupin domain-containing protein n=1 Tax=Stackebrandtia albiflava TaxID=406432 RepID=UPI0011BE0B3F
MDVLTGFLDGPRARDAFLLRASLRPPWCVDIRDRAPLSLVAVVSDEAWLLPETGPPVGLAVGDVALVRGPAPYRCADDPATPVQAIIHPGQRCTSVDGRELLGPVTGEAGEWGFGGVRTWGNTSGPTSLLVGTYPVDGQLGRALLDALPPILKMSATDWDSPLLALLHTEIGREAPGQQAMLDRLLDLVLIAVLRAWFARPDSDAPRWYRAMSDPVVGKALRLIHESPATSWTVASLAAAAGVSRAGFARRFTARVGEPPLTYLTGWRLAVAADLLRGTDATLSAVARQVGYGGPYALSAAFKRRHGVSPGRYRAEVTTGPE